eukprot:UN22208
MCAPNFTGQWTLHSLESEVFGDHIGHDICMHHSRSLTPFPNIQLLLPAWLCITVMPSHKMKKFIFQTFPVYKQNIRIKIRYSKNTPLKDHKTQKTFLVSHINQ